MAAERVAVVTGSSSGIGRAVAAELARRGHAVVVTSRAHARAAAAARAIEADGGRALAVEAELTAPGAGEALVARAIEAYGRLDVLVNNAGAGQVAAPRRSPSAASPRRTWPGARRWGGSPTRRRWREWSPSWRPTTPRT